MSSIWIFLFNFFAQFVGVLNFKILMPESFSINLTNSFLGHGGVEVDF